MVRRPVEWTPISYGYQMPSLAPQSAGGSIIPYPGDEPVDQPEILEPIYESGPYTVEAGTLIYARSLAYVFTTGSLDQMAPFTNNGVIWSVVTSSNPLEFTYITIGRYDEIKDVTNNGLIVLETGEGLIARTVAFANTNVVNTGSVYVISHGQNGATFLDFTSRFYNSGLVAVRSDYFGARGVNMNNGGIIHNEEGGSLLVEGHSPIAIVMGDSTVDSETNSHIINDGLIEVNSLGGSPSIGIYASHIYGQLDFINSGTLRAEYAYISDYGVTMPMAFVDTILNEETGRIEGHILLDRGDDVVTNHGEIVGHVLMEEGNDLFDNRGGTLVGVADMGWGNDTFHGGDGDERVAGGDGEDLLEGGGGQDLLMGGWGNDTLVGGAGADGLFGEYGDDLIETEGQDYVGGGAGDDRIVAGDFQFETLDGGTGHDTVVLNGGARKIDLSAVLEQGALADIEALVLTGQQTLCVRAADIIALTGGESALWVTLTGSDQLDLVGAWTEGADRVMDGIVWRTFTLEGRTLFVAGAGNVVPNAVPSGTGLDDLTSPLAPLPGEASGLGFTSPEVFLNAYGLTADTTVGAGQIWYSADGAAVVETQDPYTFTNDGVISSYRAADSTARNSAFAIDSAGSAGGPVINTGAILLENHATHPSNCNTFGVAGGVYSSMTNYGSISVYGASGRVSALSSGNVYNHGSIVAESGLGPVIGIDLLWYDFQNHGDITVYCGGQDPIFGDNFAGRPLSVAVVAYANSHANYGTITASSAIEGGAVGIWFEVSSGRTETFLNSGTIRADVAIHVRGTGDGRIDLTNTHILDGRVELGGGDDRVINTGTITDIIDMGAGADVFDGRGGGQVSVLGGAGDDVFYGGSGDDTFDGGTGVDHMYGGGGRDVYYADTQADLVFEFAGGGGDLVFASSNFYLYDHIEELVLTGTGNTFGVGNALDNLITGNDGDNLLLGGAGGDSIIGAAGNDSIFGEAGNDLLHGGEGIDYLVGGAGNDSLHGEDDADALYGEDGNDTLWGGSTFDTDILVGGAGNDTLRGDSGLSDYDLMDGGSGDDLYWVDTGDDLTFEAVDGGIDTVYADVRVANAGVYLYANVENLVLVGTTAFGVGNELNNLMLGNASGNYLLGGAGNDVLNGGRGNDVLFGEAGADVFVFEYRTGGDVIGDFTIGEDRIDLRGIAYDNFEQLKAGFSQVGADGAINLFNGDFIVLHGVTMADLTAADFIFRGQSSPADALASLALPSDERFAPPPARDESGPQVLPAVADDAVPDGKETGAQVLPSVADDAFVFDFGPGKDVGPQVLPGSADKGWSDTGPQILPGLDDEAPNGFALKMAIWAGMGPDLHLIDTPGANLIDTVSHHDWGWM
jgi:Ca2+-binding RTX toxin-like protein